MTEEMIARLERKLDEIAERQIDHIERIIRLEGIVTNGLSSNVKAIKDKVEAVCTGYEARLQTLEEFKWFRTWMTSLRDNIFKNLLMLALGGGVIYMVIRFGDQLIKKILA